MEDRTIGLIYALKQCNKYNTDTVICKFMREWSDSSFWDVTTTSRTEIKRILRETVVDYLVTCGNEAEIRRYFHESPFFVSNEFIHMASFLYQAQVKEQDKYVNGFRDNPYPNYEVFIQE